MKEKIINILKFLVCFLSFYFIDIIVVKILNIFGLDVTKFSDFNFLLLKFITSLIIFIILLFLYFKDIKKEFKTFKKDLNKNIWFILKMFVVFMVVKFLVSIVSTLLIKYFGYDLESINSVNQQTVEAYVKISPLLMTLTSSVLAPFYEEFLFRLGIKKIIKNKYLFMIFSGLLFGLLHIFPLAEGISLTLGLIQSITYVSMGIFLAYIYEKSNIYNSIGVHFLNNLLSILFMISTL